MLDPIVAACDRWKARVIALGIVVGTILIVAAVLLLEARTLHDVWVFTHAALVLPCPQRKVWPTDQLRGAQEIFPTAQPPPPDRLR